MPSTWSFPTRACRSRGMSVAPGIPTALEILTAIASELEVEAVVFADELTSRDTDLPSAVARLFPGASASSVPHVEFKRMTEDAVAVVRTGECSPYYNVILISGVTY